MSLTRPINLESYEDFRNHSWILSFVSKYEKDALIAEQSVARLLCDLEKLNGEYTEQQGRVLFSNIEGRVKEENSFFKKFYKQCCEKGISRGITQSILNEFYNGVNDVAGVRFSCPYIDEVESAISKIRNKLSALGYAVQIDGNEYKDRNYLDIGDGTGYRSYHFFLKVPTPIDIFGNAELFLYEVQGRSELQHVWAVKSHDLLYKPENGWIPHDDNVTEDMKQLSNSLRAADQFLISIRDRVRGKS